MPHPVSAFSPSAAVSRRAALVYAGACACAPLAAPAAEVAGVKFEDRISVAGASLVLNGAGIRYKAMFQVYAAGLYLSRKADTPEGVLSATGPKRLSITMLRDIDSRELGKLFARGMEDNMDRSIFSRLIPGVMRMSEVFSRHKQLRTGETFQVDWVPGAGTVITVKGQVEGEPFKEPEFFQALMLIWLGPWPADWQLKDALLGKAPSSLRSR